MYRLIFVWQLLMIKIIIEASHFRGGTITWKPINNNITNLSQVSVMITQTYTWANTQIACTSSMIAAQSPVVNLIGHAGYGVNLMCIADCLTAGGYVGNEVSITGPCTDFSTPLNLTVSQRSDVFNLTAGSYFTVAFATSGGWQPLALGSSTSWSVSSRIDLRIRSDDGLINTPPVATCISYLSIPANVQQTIQVPVIDTDNDFIRCRFANGSSECVNTCPPGSLPPGTNLSSSCALTITGPTAGKYYLVALQVEDFMTSTSVTPMSSVPIQFLIFVYAATNCTLKPLLIGNVNDGDCQGVQVGLNFIITLTAINRCGDERTMVDIATLSFPTVIKSALIQNASNSSLWSLQLTWQPTALQVGSQVFCAVATDNASVQSDQYCTTFSVGLSSLPLCPGVVPSTTTSMIIEITTNTAKPNSVIDWPLIIGLSLLASLLALCCACYCCYYFFGSAGRRRRRQRKKSPRDQDDSVLRPRRDTVATLAHPHYLSYLKIFKRPLKIEDYQLRRNSNASVATNPSSFVCSMTSASAGANASKVFQQENTVRDPSNPKAADPCRTQSHVSVQKIERDDKIIQSLSVAMNPDDLSTMPHAESVVSGTNRVDSIKQPHLNKLPVEPHQLTPSKKVNAQSRKHKPTDSNNTCKRTTSQIRVSNVSVRRVNRSLSANEVNHTVRFTTKTPVNNIMSSETIQQSRVTVVRRK